MYHKFNLLCANLFFALVLFSISFANAIPPSYTYRADFRGPDEIFKNGFSSRGSNDDLVAHVSGASCLGNTGSNFVATSESMGFVERWARDLIYIHNHANVDLIYIYTIRATNDFYNTERSLIALDTPNTTALAAHYRHQQEYVATHGITPEQIANARIYMRNNGGLTLIGEIQNQRYTPATTQANDLPYRPHTQATESARPFVQLYLPGACFKCSSSKNNCDNIPSNYVDPLTFTLNNFKSSVRTATCTVHRDH